MAKIVKITIEGGIVQHVEVPEGVEVVVHDYDPEGVDEDRLSKDDNDDLCVVTVWKHEG